MKKIIILTAISLFVASSAFASGDISMTLSGSTGLSVWGAKTGGTAASGTNLIGKTSSGVGVGIKTASTGYAAITQHKNGTKAFGSSFDSTSIYSAPVTTVGTALLAIPTATTSADFTGAWTSM